MNLNEFPFRVDERTHAFLSDITGAMVRNRCKFQSLVQGQVSLLVQKDKGVGLDGNVIFTPEGVVVTYPIKAISSQDRKAAAWLNRYHGFLQKQKKSELRPVINRCFVMVKCFLNGNMEYYLTYLVAYEDESIAQDTAQGALYAKEILNIGRVARQQVPEGSQESGGHW